MNALLVQHLDGGRLRITSTPMLARRGTLHAEREHDHDGRRGLLLADGSGTIVCWITEADWRLTPHQPARGRLGAPRGPAQARRPAMPLLRLPLPAAEAARSVEPTAATAETQPAPPEINPAAATAWHLDMVGALARLVVDVPPVFAELKEGDPLKPIGQSYSEWPRQPYASTISLRAWFQAWSGHPAYRAALEAPDAQWHGADGAPIGPVLRMCLDCFDEILIPPGHRLCKECRLAAGEAP